ncbi:uncharacterized protein GGS25DRAFT_9734 [Hypoxylon fragiforme]|uniref:uncharacterized protein n=1 Tax=Hypoxylon fragiforme TaxID=63214 RepID=UPI0020C74490|nr:uncharacterized protein GGS25DRAFT_9734 [Hypoxylon fragiforme]KAI2613659.1 hypothetical protein GGS25DRAFT_9734 [Hypoxylon fragiforme]
MLPGLFRTITLQSMGTVSVLYCPLILTMFIIELYDRTNGTRGSAFPIHARNGRQGHHISLKQKPTFNTISRRSRASFREINGLSAKRCGASQAKSIGDGQAQIHASVPVYRPRPTQSDIFKDTAVAGHGKRKRHLKSFKPGRKDADRKYIDPFRPIGMDNKG